MADDHVDVPLPLQGKHLLALEQVLQWLPAVAAPVGIVVSGSIVRGNPGPNSDLDVVVLQANQGRRRIQRWFSQTPVEIFVNSEAWLTHSMEAECAEGRPVMAHMLATGLLLRDTDGRMSALQSRGRALLERGPNPTPDAMLRNRYAAALQVEDALDFEGNDTADSRRTRAQAVDALLSYAFLQRNLFLPRQKERLAALASLSPGLAKLLEDALSGGSASMASAALKEAAVQELGTIGFFEWDSGPDASCPVTSTSRKPAGRLAEPSSAPTGSSAK